MPTGSNFFNLNNLVSGSYTYFCTLPLGVSTITLINDSIVPIYLPTVKIKPINKHTDN